MHSFNIRLFGIMFFLLGIFALQEMDAQEKDSRGKDFWLPLNIHPQPKVNCMCLAPIGCFGPVVLEWFCIFKNHPTWKLHMV
jgi:hypothetical protein